MATPPLTDQERALLAQFVASHTSNPGDAPILIQYALDRLARQPGSTLTEVVSALSPNGLDAGADYGAYLDAVNRVLGPADVAPQDGLPARESDSGAGGRAFDWSGARPDGVMAPVQGPLADVLAVLTGNAPARVAPSHVQVASLDPLPSATPAPQIAPVRQPAAQPAAVQTPPSSIPIFEPPLPTRTAPPDRPPPPSPAGAVRPSSIAPPSAPPPRATAISPTGPFLENAPGPNGTTNPNKDQSRLTPSSPLDVAAGQGPATRSVQSVPVAPSDLISRSFESLPPSRSPFGPQNSGEDLAFNPVNAAPTSAAAANAAPRTLLPPIAPSTLPPTNASLPPLRYPPVESLSLAAKGYGPLLEMLDGPPAPIPETMSVDMKQMRNTSAALAAPTIAAAPSRLDGPIQPSGAKQAAAPMPAMQSEDLFRSRQPATGNAQVSPADMELIIRAAATEVDPRIARTNPDAYQLQVQRTVDVMLNRLASDQFPQTAAEMLNQRNQFSAINGPVARPGVENIPAARVDDGLRAILEPYLADRLSGRVPSSVGGAVNYANPGASDASNLPWVNALNYAVDDAGPFSHRYGVAQGMRPAEAVFGRPADYLSSGVMNAFSRPEPSRLDNSSKRVEVKASRAPISELMGSTAMPSRIDRNTPTAQRPTSDRQQPVAREPISNAFTQPAARPTAAPARVASQSPAKLSSPTVAANNNGSGGSGFSTGFSSTPSFAGSNTGGSGSRSATASTSGASNSATNATRISATTASTSRTTPSNSSSSASRLDNVTSRPSSDQQSSSSSRSYNPRGR